MEATLLLVTKGKGNTKEKKKVTTAKASSFPSRHKHINVNTNFKGVVDYTSRSFYCTGILRIFHLIKHS